MAQAISDELQDEYGYGDLNFGVIISKERENVVGRQIPSRYIIFTTNNRHLLVIVTDPRKIHSNYMILKLLNTKFENFSQKQTTIINAGNGVNKRLQTLVKTLTSNAFDQYGQNTNEVARQLERNLNEQTEFSWYIVVTLDQDNVVDVKYPDKQHYVEIEYNNEHYVLAFAALKIELTLNLWLLYLIKL